MSRLAQHRPSLGPVIALTVALVVLFGVVVLPALRNGDSAPAKSGRPTAAATTKTTSRPATDPASGLRWVDLSKLPKQASDTMAQIKAGPPYRYPRNDGVVYHNYNRVLPSKPDGYYLEFTVVTPGSSTRGARRIIDGGPDRGQANAEWYYTGDHYDTFERIRP